MTTDKTKAPRALSARLSKLVPDALASLVVVLVAIPLCIGIAVACGVPAERGLVTAIIGGIIVGYFSGAPLLVSGPAASLIVPVFDLVQSRGLGALAPVVVLAGVWQIIAGRLRLGQWFRAIAPAVIHGMLIGIGILIVSSQLHVAIDGDPKSSFLSNLSSFPGALVDHVSGADGPGGASALLGLATIVILVMWNRFRPHSLRLIPGHLVALLVVMVAVGLFFEAPVRFLDISKDFFAGLELIELDSLHNLLEPSIIGLSLMFAFVASAATLLTAVAIDQRQTQVRTDYNRELVAQGLGNALTGMVGGLPMTGVIVRSSVNVDAGAQTRWSTILHGVWILGFVAVAPEVLELIPRACLGAILVYTGFKLIDYRILYNLYQRGRAELVICLITIFGVVFLELFIGILLGLGAALAKIVYTFSHLEVRRDTDAEGDLHLTLNGSATFLRVPMLAETLERVPPDRSLHLHIDQLEHIDHACLELFSSWEQRREAQGQAGLMVDWSVLTGRYHRTFLGLPDADSREGETEGAVLSLMWSEWKRVYGPQELARDSLLPADWIETSRVRLGLEASELDVVLDEAARVLAPAAGKPADELGAALRARASDGHISLGEGVSIPHAPIAGLERPLAALVTTKEPVDVAGDKADLFFVLLAPATDPRRHLLSLAHVGRICHDDKVLSTLRAASDPAAVVAILLQSEERFEAHPAPRGDARLLAILELASFEQVERVVEILDEGVTHPVVLSDRDGAPYETLRAALRLPRSRRLALLSIEERDKNVLAGLMAELSRLWPNEEQVRVHILRPEIALPSHTNDADEGS